MKTSSELKTAKQARRYTSLSRRLVLQFCLFTLLLSAVYGAIAFVLMYTLEDNFIYASLEQEANYLRQQHQQSGQWPATRSPGMQLHFSTASFPPEIRQLAEQEPQRLEFYGSQGRHYHLYPFAEHPDLYLLAEVGDALQVRPIRAGVMQLFGISAVIVTLLACLLAWLVSRRTTRPLKQLAQLVEVNTIDQIPAQFAQHFPNNEIGKVAATLEQSLQRIAHTLEREKCFTRDVSHELRTPLAVVQNAAELLASQNQKGQPQPALERIAKAAEQMQKTVHTLLMLAREEHNKAEKSQVNLLPLIEQAVLDQQSLLTGKAVMVVLHPNCQSQVFAQAGMLKVLLDNLLSNAFQHTQQGEVSIHYEDGVLRVKDTGCGIEPAIAGQITEAAVKGSHSSGFGFGLSIVKRLCEHQGWQLAVDTGNTGTTVSVALL